MIDSVKNLFGANKRDFAAGWRGRRAVRWMFTYKKKQRKTASKTVMVSL
jgi:hypothetical protein